MLAGLLTPPTVILGLCDKKFKRSEAEAVATIGVTAFLDQ